MEKTFNYVPSAGIKKDYLKIIGVILSETKSYTISNRMLALQISFVAGYDKKDKMDENSVLAKLAKNVCNALKPDDEKEPDAKSKGKKKKETSKIKDQTFLNIFLREDHAQDPGSRLRSNKKRTRIELLEIPTHQTSPKIRLEAQLTRVIKTVTR